MIRVTGLLRSFVVVAACAWATGGSAWAQRGADGFITGQVSTAWDKWQTAIRAILARDMDAAETAFGEMLALQAASAPAEPSLFETPYQPPSPMRIALMAERTVMRTTDGGGVLLLEDDNRAGKLKPNAAAVAEQLSVGREQLRQADDGWYFASVGRFDISDANFKALLDADPDPVALLEFADRVRARHAVLMQLADNPVVGESGAGAGGTADQGRPGARQIAHRATG